MARISQTIITVIWKSFKILIPIGLSLVFLILIYFSLIETPYRPVAVLSTPMRYQLPQVIAHKALHPAFPSNSLEGIEALILEGIRGIEIDIQISQDGVPILFHGGNLSEGSTGKGVASALPYTELEKLFLTKAGNPTTFKIPSLERVLQLYCKKAVLVLDVKSFGVFDQSITEKTVELVRKYGCQDSVIFDALNPAILLKVRELDETIPVSLSFLEDKAATIEETQAQLDEIPFFLTLRVTHNLLRALLLPDYLSPRFSIPSDQIQKLSKLGYPLVAWTVDDPNVAVQLLSLGVQSIVTNQPKELRAAIKSTIVDDASRLNSSSVSNVFVVGTTEEIRDALVYATTRNLKVSIAGKRHSMGGQTIAPSGVVIDMNWLNKITFDQQTNLLTAQAGATWKEIQDVLDGYGRSVQVMQSDNIFSLGGSLSVNAHGWQPNRAPLASTVAEFELILPNGEVVRCRRPFVDVCRAALGGYGLVGVITEATLETTENVALVHQSKYVHSSRLVEELRGILHKPDLELLYARLRVDKAEFLNEAGIHFYTRANPQPELLPKLQPEALVRTKRAVFRLSESGDAGKVARWLAERDVLEYTNAKLGQAVSTRNQVMYSDFHFLWPADFSSHDILHEYFIPIDKAQDFIDTLRLITTKHNQNLLNVTVRHLQADEVSLLPYVREESFSFVLLFSQRAGVVAEESMRLYTQELIDRALDLGGSFYLPYRRHYTDAQLVRGYPSLTNFIQVKRANDSSLLFQNMLWENFAATQH